jgi:hypothetical protein
MTAIALQRLTLFWSSGYLVYWLSGKPNFWVRASIITEVIVTPVRSLISVIEKELIP